MHMVKLTRNQMASIETEDVEIIEAQEDIKGHYANAYTTKFEASEVQFTDEFMNHNPKEVTPSENISLTAMPTDQEIQTVFSLNSDSSPGPDALNRAYLRGYKDVWVVSDSCAALRSSAMATGKQLEIHQTDFHNSQNIKGFKCNKYNSGIILKHMICGAMGANLVKMSWFCSIAIEEMSSRIDESNGSGEILVYSRFQFDEIIDEGMEQASRAFGEVAFGYSWVSTEDLVVSLEDFTKEKPVKISTDIKKLRELVSEGTMMGLPFQDSSIKNEMVYSLYFPVCNELVNNGASQRKRDRLEMSEPPEAQLTSSIGFGVKSDVKIALINDPCESDPFSEAPCKDSDSCTLDISKLLERPLTSPIELDVKIVEKATPMHETCESCPDSEVPCRDPVACMIEIGNDVHIESNLVLQKSSAVSGEKADHTKENMVVHDNMEPEDDIDDARQIFMDKHVSTVSPEGTKYDLDFKVPNKSGQNFKTGEDMIEMYTQLGKDYLIVSIEEPFDKDDWEHTKLFTCLGICQEVHLKTSVLQVEGDDLLMSNPKRIEKTIGELTCNALLLKLLRIEEELGDETVYAGENWR
ncbi:hypothetical protein GIB67_038713 [Kingdonia uniflora]|uniref:phosphopyruvate hydratase n=1 Tax=Kingdonia uniflora TaxID=39325 RepID=A0A7J7NT04_9MAGN|nr:hypothetical protein GIB67_038713 [Kingdonia uniflora]